MLVTYGPATPAAGTRNFSCTSQPLQFGPAMGLGTARGVLQDGTQLTCVWYYSSPFEGVHRCVSQLA